MKTEIEAGLREGLPQLGLEPADDLVRSLAHFLRLLERWNRAFNLTGTRDPEEMVSRHVFDSLSALPFLHGISVLDVGSGAGLPGLPLAMVEGRRQFTLLDSSGKKLRFIRHAIGELKLENVATVQVRAEDYTPADPFDTVICRAFSSLGDFARRCGRLVGGAGRLLAMKGRSPDLELQNLPEGWQATEVARLQVPGLESRRHMVVMERRH